MSMRRRFIPVLALLTLAGGLMGTGCERRDNNGTTRLELWTLALRPTFDDYVTSVIEAFEAEHPGVDVVWVDVPFDALSRKLIAAAAAGQAADVVNFSDLQFARFASLGATADLAGHLPGDPAERYLPGALRVGALHDQLMGLPWYLTPSVRIINTALIREAGLAPEDLANDWDGLRAQAMDYHAKTGGFLFSLPLGEESALPQMLLASGVIPFAEDDEGRLVADLTRPDVVKRVQAWVDFYRSGALPRAAATRGHAHLIELYQNGQLALIQSGPNFLSRIRDVAPDVFDATVVAPAVTGSLQRSHIPVMLVSVMSTSKHPDLAAELAWWITSPENQLAFCRIVNILPSTPASLADPHFAPPAPDATGSEAMLARARALSTAALPNAVAFTPTLETWPDLRRAFDEHIKSALLDGASVPEVLATIEAEWNRILRAAVPATLDAVPQPTRAATTSTPGGAS